MDAACLLRPAAKLTSSRLLPARPNTVASIRFESTVNRHKRALNVPPHPSFLVDALQQQSHIIFNPPSSAASIYHTPFKFLPTSDPRRRANLTHLFGRSGTGSSSVTAQPSDGNLPPPLKDSVPKYHLTEEDVAEMRRLREADPETNSVATLARKFKCTRFFVSMCTQAPREKIEAEKRKKEAIKSRWGPIRTKAREDRRRRYEMVLRGEL